MCCDVTICFEEVGKDLCDGACDETCFVVYEVCKVFIIYSCVDLLDDGSLKKVTKVECAYGFIV